MMELRNQKEKSDWLSTRKRIGFIGNDNMPMVDSGIWIIELYKKEDGGYSVLYILDGDESEIVCDIE